MRAAATTEATLIWCDQVAVLTGSQNTTGVLAPGSGGTTTTGGGTTTTTPTLTERLRDDFARPDGDFGSNYTWGGNSQGNAATGADYPQIVSGRLRLGVAGNVLKLANISCEAFDVTLDFALDDGAGVSLNYRLSDGANYFALVVQQSGNSVNANLYAKVSSNAGSAGSSTVSAINPGATNTVRVTLDKNFNHAIYINGAQQFTSIESHPTGLSMALEAQGDQGSSLNRYVDNLLVLTS